jgi:hypothetical protein
MNLNLLPIATDFPENWQSLQGTTKPITATEHLTKRPDLSTSTSLRETWDPC